MSDKTLVERLREVNLDYDQHTDCQLANVVGVDCTSATCAECGMDTAHALADAIEREYLPRPRYEDGEPVQFGDAYTDKYGRVWENGIRSVHIDCNGNFSLHSYVRGGGGMFEEFEPNEHVKNTFHDVLDADDVPIRVGDTVYELGTGEAFEVEEITSADTFCVLVTEGWYFAPCLLTHKQPDSLERIAEDAKKITWDYWECSGVDCCDCPVKMDGKNPRERYDTSR